MRTVEKILILLLLILIIAASFIGLCNIELFNIKEVQVTVTGSATDISIDMQRLILPLKGKNILQVRTKALEKQLESFDAVKTVEIERYYPDKLIINVNYNNISSRAFSIDENNNINYYLIYDNTLEEVSSYTWEAFEKLNSVELNPAFAQMVLKWGSDEGFKNMVTLVEHLSLNNLISSMKYHNNNGSAFGRLTVEFSSLNVMLNISENVSVKRLEEALLKIENQFSAGSAMVVYDLYANTLVKRT